MGKIIEERRKFSDERFELLRESLEQAEEICGDRACVYATGSFGRREASPHSDIDLFIVSLSDQFAEDRIVRSRLSKLDEILLKAELIRASKNLDFPPFSKDGRFLEQHTAWKLIKSTGDQYDDAENTFTARLLLLLESRPLIAKDVHSKIIDDVIAKYWSEFQSHSDRFMPAYLANDVLRYWRTLCLNYEANTSEEALKYPAKRRINNYKLKHSRMLTCYSALLVLLHVFVKSSTVGPSDVQRMVYQSPTQRMEWLAADAENADFAKVIQQLLNLYERFLDVTSASKEELIHLFSDDIQAGKLRDERSEFGDLVHRALYLIGQNNNFYRRLVV
jgi:predicted nucleotidyltransferase